MSQGSGDEEAKAEYKAPLPHFTLPQPWWDTWGWFAWEQALRHRLVSRRLLWSALGSHLWKGRKKNWEKENYCDDAKSTKILAYPTGSSEAEMRLESCSEMEQMCQAFTPTHWPITEFELPQEVGMTQTRWISSLRQFPDKASSGDLLARGTPRGWRKQSFLPKRGAGWYLHSTHYTTPNIHQFETAPTSQEFFIFLFFFLSLQDCRREGGWEASSQG